MITTPLKYITDLDRDPVKVAIPNLLHTADQDAHKISVTVCRSSTRQVVDLTGAIVTGYFIRSDSTTVLLPGQVEDGCAVCVLPAPCYARQGSFALIIKAELDGVVHSIFHGTGTVVCSQTDTMADPEGVLPSLEELTAIVAEVKELADLTVQIQPLAAGAEATADYQAGTLILGIPQGKQGEPGTPGQDGQDGKDGKAATVKIGTVTTLAAGSNATVFNNGTDTAAVLHFGIPVGKQGEPGAPGQDGQDGKDGQTATIKIGSVTTLAAGSSATLSNSGTDTAAVLHFGIPMGKQGEPGAPGQDGQDGKTPVKGTDYFTSADKAEMVTQVVSAMGYSTETWTFTLSDGSTVTKKVVLA